MKYLLGARVLFTTAKTLSLYLRSLKLSICLHVRSSEINGYIQVHYSVNITQHWPKWWSSRLHRIKQGVVLLWHNRKSSLNGRLFVHNNVKRELRIDRLPTKWSTSFRTCQLRISVITLQCYHTCIMGVRFRGVNQMSSDKDSQLGAELRPLHQWIYINVKTFESLKIKRPHLITMRQWNYRA